MNVHPTNVVTRTKHQQRTEGPNQQPGPDHNPENGGSHTITDGPHTVRPQSAMPSVRSAGTAGTRVPRYSGSRRVLAVFIGLLTAVTVLSSCGLSQGTVVSKGYEPSSSYSCQTGSVQVGQTSVPIFGTCYIPECWYLGLQDGKDNGSVCVSYQLWDRTNIGSYYPPGAQQSRT